MKNPTFQNLLIFALAPLGQALASAIYGAIVPLSGYGIFIFAIIVAILVFLTGWMDLCREPLAEDEKAEKRFLARQFIALVLPNMLAPCWFVATLYGPDKGKSAIIVFVIAWFIARASTEWHYLKATPEPPPKRSNIRTVYVEEQIRVWRG